PRPGIALRKPVQRAVEGFGIECRHLSSPGCRSRQIGRAPEQEQRPINLDLRRRCTGNRFRPCLLLACQDLHDIRRNLPQHGQGAGEHGAAEAVLHAKDAQGQRHSALVVEDRDGDGADAVIRLVVVGREALASDPVESAAPTAQVPPQRSLRIIVAQAEALGIETPVCRTLLRLVRHIETAQG
ncbi:MAG: hypothetical protein V7668_11710, partial [Cereibacter changlensis]